MKPSWLFSIWFERDSGDMRSYYPAPGFQKVSFFVLTILQQDFRKSAFLFLLSCTRISEDFSFSYYPAPGFQKIFLFSYYPAPGFQKIFFFSYYPAPGFQKDDF